MGGFVLKLKHWWETADRTQRMVAIGGGAFLVLMIAVTTMFAMRPHMVIAFGGLDSANQGMVVAELDKDGIASEADAQGNIMVASDKVTEAKIKLATAGKLPTNSQYGDDQLAKLGMMSTPAVEKERLKTILEGRLSDTITGINGITGAVVHLVLAEDSPFIKDAKPATASVSITERPGSLVTSEQGQVIATIVANSTPGLSINNVAVVNSRMEMLFDGSNRSSANGRANEKLQAEVAEGNRRARELQGMLDQVFGAGSTIAKVNLTLDFDEKTVVSDQSEPVKMPVSSQTETMTGGAKPGSSGLGAPGSPATGSEGSKYESKVTQNQFVTNTVHTEAKPTAGAVKSMAIDVIVNSDKKIGDKPLAATDVESILKGYLGSNANDKNYTATVTPVAFDTTAAKAIDDSAKSAKSSAMMQQIISMLPIAALLFVGFLVMKAIGKFSSGPTMVLAGGGSTLPVPYSPSALPGSSEGLLRAVDRVAGSDGGGLRMVGGDQEDDESDAQLAAIKGISRKVNVPLEQIKKMSSDRPETVAMLIKGWLLEER